MSGPQTGDVIVSGLGDRDTGGGLFHLHDGSVQRIDWLACTGIALSDEADLIVRLLRTGDDLGAAGEVLVYDRRGVRSYHRVDELLDAHDVVWHDGLLVVSSPSSNSLLWLDEAGRVVERWSPPGAIGDAWHLNCLLVVDGRLLACAFGEFATHRGWMSSAAAGAGFVFDVRTGRRVLEGLTYPHHPRRVDDRWLVCDSGGHAVIVLDEAGRRRGEVALGRWTRGLSFDDDWVYVGCSANRHDPAADPTASVSILERQTLREVERLSVPSREIYDVLVVPAELVSGLRRGFDNNPLRVADQAQYAMFREAGVEPDRLWALGDPLPPAACRSELELELPDEAPCAGGAVSVRYRVTNRGSAVLVSVPPNPVMLSWRWFSDDGSRLIAEGDRIALPGSLPPGQTASGRLWLRMPPDPGTYLLRASLVQELVRWFDDLDPQFGYRRLIDLVAEGYSTRGS